MDDGELQILDMAPFILSKQGPDLKSAQVQVVLFFRPMRTYLCKFIAQVVAFKPSKLDGYAFSAVGDADRFSRQIEE